MVGQARQPGPPPAASTSPSSRGHVERHNVTLAGSLTRIAEQVRAVNAAARGAAERAGRAGRSRRQPAG